MDAPLGAPARAFGPFNAPYGRQQKRQSAAHQVIARKASADSDALARLTQFFHHLRSWHGQVT